MKTVVPDTANVSRAQGRRDVMAARRSVANVASALHFNSEPMAIPDKQDEEGEKYEGRLWIVGILVSIRIVVRLKWAAHGIRVASDLTREPTTSHVRGFTNSGPRARWSSHEDRERSTSGVS